MTQEQKTLLPEQATIIKNRLRLGCSANITETGYLLQALETEMRKVERAREVILGSIGVFEMYENISTTEEFAEARSCRLSVKLACEQALKELEE